MDGVKSFRGTLEDHFNELSAQQLIVATFLSLLTRLTAKILKGQISRACAPCLRT